MSHLAIVLATMIERCLLYRPNRTSDAAFVHVANAGWASRSKSVHKEHAVSGASFKE